MRQKIFSFILLLLPCLCAADNLFSLHLKLTDNVAQPAQFELNKDYKIVAKPNPSTDTHKIRVDQFFNYGCPACFLIEPTLETWLITKPKDVDFERVPVLFHQEWYPLAKAYFTAKNLNIVNRITPVIFDAIHKQHQDLTSRDALLKFFQKNGVKPDDFAGAYDFTPEVDAQIQHGDALMRDYNIYQIPSFVVNGTYVTDLALTNGDPKRLFSIVDFLIKKVRTEPLKPEPPKKA